MTYKVLVIDDSHSITQSLKNLIESNIDINWYFYSDTGEKYALIMSVFVFKCLLGGVQWHSWLQKS